MSSSPGQTGFIVYTASGHLMVHMMQPYRRRNAGGPPTPEETMAAYRSYTSYFGPYTVNESDSTSSTTSPARSIPVVSGATFSGSSSFRGSG